MAKFIAQAIKHPGAFTAEAKAAGYGVQAFARHVLSANRKAKAAGKEGPYSGMVIRRAVLAKTLRKIARS